MSKIEVDKVDPQSGTALEIGTSGDTVTVPSGVGLTLTNSTLLLPTTITSTTEVKTNKISPATGVAFALGDSGDTFTVPSGATIVNSGTATGFGGGKVLQVISATDNTERPTTSATFALNSSTLTLDITPASTDNKIYVVASFNQSTGANDGVFTIFRDSTNLGSAVYGLSYCLSQGGYWYGGQSISVFETAPSTSALTYQVRFRAGSGDTITLNEGPALGNITAWEIEG